jgi:hypothetical protein
MHGTRQLIHPAAVGDEITCAPAPTFTAILVAVPRHSAGCPNKMISATTANAAAHGIRLKTDASAC